MFWAMVCIAYSLLMAVGLLLGFEIAKRRPPRGGQKFVPPAPDDDMPAGGLEWGTDFDRSVLPEVDFTLMDVR